MLLGILFILSGIMSLNNLVEAKFTEYDNIIGQLLEKVKTRCKLVAFVLIFQNTFSLADCGFATFLTELFMLIEF